MRLRVNYHGKAIQFTTPITNTTDCVVPPPPQAERMQEEHRRALASATKAAVIAAEERATERATLEQEHADAMTAAEARHEHGIEEALDEAQAANAQVLEALTSELELSHRYVSQCIFQSLY